MRRPNNFATPGQILPALFRERDWERQWELHEVYARWPEIAGPEAGANSAPVSLRNGDLWLHVSHAAWAQELAFRQDELLRRVRALMPGRAVSGIRCRVEPSWFADSAGPPAHREPAQVPPPESFAAIADAPARAALIRLWRTLQGLPRRNGDDATRTGQPRGE